VDVIDAGRLVLRPIRRAEAQVVLNGGVPDGVVLGEGYPSRFTREVMERHVRGDELGPYGPYFMVRKADGAVIGEIGCGVPDGSDTGYVGYSVVEPCWGQGYATDALRALLGFVLGRPEVRRVLAQTLREHGASRRVMEKAGMRYVRQEAGVEDDEPVELVVYEAVGELVER
jgi:[ribosomal protein S5]-alanine N-acetyltransferase